MSTPGVVLSGRQPRQLGCAGAGLLLRRTALRQRERRRGQLLRRLRPRRRPALHGRAGLRWRIQQLPAALRPRPAGPERDLQ